MDLWELPKLIYSINPSYRFFLRSHGEDGADFNSLCLSRGPGWIFAGWPWCRIMDHIGLTSGFIHILDRHKWSRGLTLAIIAAFYSIGHLPARRTFSIINRYFLGVGKNVRICIRSYDNFINRDPRKAYPSSVDTFKSFKLTFLIFLADVAKAQGLFQEAEAIYRQLSANHASAYEALCSLGDLMLTQAQWADEFRAHASDGRVIDPQGMLAPDRWTWHRRTYQEAIDILQCAIEVNPNDERASLHYAAQVGGCSTSH